MTQEEKVVEELVVETKQEETTEQKETTKQQTADNQKVNRDYVEKKKCSYNINQTVLKTFLTDLNDTKMEDMGVIYQPCKDNAQLVQKFDGKNKSALIEEGDVDTVSTVASANAEFSISLASAVGLLVSNI